MPQDQPLPQWPQGPSRPPGGGGWRPDEHLRPLPPGYEPAHHEPRYGETRPAPPQDPRRPAQASYDPGEFPPQDQYGERGEDGERGDYAGRGRFGEPRSEGRRGGRAGRPR